MSDRLCILGLDKLNDNYLNIFRPVCLFYKMKSIFPKHIKSWLGVCAAICGVCAKNAPDTMQELSKQFISTDVFTYKDTNNSQIQLADIPFTEYKFVIDNDISYIFNICKKIIRRAQLQLTDFIAVCEYPDDIPCDELFDDTFEYDDAEASSIQQTHHDIENIESEQASASEDETPEQRTLQADQITNTTNYEAFAPIALIINNGDDENLLRLTATTWRDIVTQLFDYLSAQDEGILRRYYRNSPSTSVITERKDEIARDSEPLCNSEYRFKAGCSDNDLVTAIPDIINQSMFSPEQFAIDYIRANASHNAQNARAIEAEIDTIQKKYFQEALTELDANPTPSPSTKYSPKAPKGEYVSFAQPKEGMAVTAYGASARYTDLEHIDLQKYTHTKATAVYYDGECVAEINSWKDAYYEVFVLIQKRSPSFYGPYRKVNCLYPVSKMSSFVNARGECHAVQIPHTDYCIDVKKSVIQIIRDLKKVVALSTLDGNLLFITYAHTEKSLARQEEQDESFEQPVSEPETVAFTQNATEPETTDFEQPATADEQRITFSTKLDYKSLLQFTRPNAVYYDGKLISTAKQWKLIYFDIFLFVKDKSRFLFKKILPYLYKLEDFNPTTQKIGARDAARIPDTDKCIILEKSVQEICNDIYALCNDFHLDGSKLVITYTQSNRTVRTSRADSIEPPKPVAATVPQAPKVAAAAPAQTAQSDEQKRNKLLQAICQKAKEMQVWQPFMICYLLLNGPQTQRMLIDAYNPNQTSGEDNKCRSILYWIANSRDWLTRTGERYNQYFSIPDADACLADPYVLKVIAGVIQYLDKLPEIAPEAPAAPVIDPDDQTKHSIAPDDQTRRNIEQILAQNFQYGYTHGIRQQEKFKEAYQNTFGKAIDCEDLDATIDSIAFLIDDRAYSFEAVLPQPRFEELTRTIDNWFEDGAPFIEYDALLQTCELLPIQTAIVLRAYLSHHFRDRYTFAPKTFAPNPAPELDEPLPETIANEVLYTGDITSLDTIAERFPYLTRETIASHLSANEDILMDKENIMHTEAVGLDESDIDTLRNTLNPLLDANPVLSYKQFIDELTESDVYGADQLSNLLDASPAMLQQYLFRKLGDEFSFAKAISRLEDESGQISDTSIADIMANEFSGKTRIEMSEIEEVVKKYGLVNWFQPEVFKYLYNHYCRVSKDLFVSDSELDFNIYAIDQAIDEQCPNNYLPLQDFITTKLPYSNHPWNEYLLLSYLYRFSERYAIKNKTVTTKYGRGGMIVKKNTTLDISDYRRILASYISQTDYFPKTVEDLGELLVEHGLIVRKSSSLSGILAEAKRLKERKHV